MTPATITRRNVVTRSVGSTLRGVDEEPESDEISLGYYRGSLDAVLTALERANLDGAVLELDGAPTDDTHDFAEAQTADRPDLLEKNLYARNGWFQNRWIKLGGGFCSYRAGATSSAVCSS